MKITTKSLLEQQRHVFKEAIGVTREPGRNTIKRVCSSEGKNVGVKLSRVN